MPEVHDLSSLTSRLVQTLGVIETMLNQDRLDTEQRLADYREALRRKAAGELTGNVTAQFFSEPALRTG